MVYILNMPRRRAGPRLYNQQLYTTRGVRDCGARATMWQSGNHTTVTVSSHNYALSVML